MNLSHLPVTRVAADEPLSSLPALRNYTGLLYFLVWRDVKVRYKQTVLGVLWAIIQPLGLVAAATFAFGRIARLGMDIPYPLFAAAGIVPWLYFARSVSDAADSVVKNERLLTKIFFPRILLPVASALAVTVETLIALMLLIVMLLVWGEPLTWRALMLVPSMAIALATSVGLGAAAAAINVRYRDARYAIPFIVQFGFLLTPVIYPRRAVPPQWRTILDLNPLSGAIDGVRWSLMGSGPLPTSFWVAACIALFMLVVGISSFRAAEDAFADVI